MENKGNEEASCQLHFWELERQSMGVTGILSSNDLSLQPPIQAYLFGPNSIGRPDEPTIPAQR